jgi:single-stranded DNA-binding protein
MLNQVILVGKVVEIENNEPRVTIRVDRTNQINREEDLIPIKLTRALAESSFEYIREGTTLGIKASLEVAEGIVSVVADKLTFINTK